MLFTSVSVLCIIKELPTKLYSLFKFCMAYGFPREENNF